MARLFDYRAYPLMYDESYDAAALAVIGGALGFVLLLMLIGMALSAAFHFVVSL